MKRNKIAIILAFVTLGLSSCLKDDNYVDPKTGTSFVELPNGELSATGFELSPTATDFLIEVNYAGAETAPGDVVVSLTLDPAAIAAYNSAHASTYELLPTAAYTVASTNATIAKGKRSGFMVVKINTTAIDLTKKYALAYTIKTTTAGSISGNFHTTVFGIAVKNKYDGVYAATGVFNHPTAGPRDIKQDKTLKTVDATTVETTIGDLGSLMKLSVNPTTNAVTVIGQLSASQPLIPVPGKTNTYDPATKTYKLNYQYTGGGGLRVIQEDIKKK